METESNQKEPLDLHALHTLYSGCTPAEKCELIEWIWKLERILAEKDSEIERLTTQVDDIADECGCQEETSNRHSHGRCIFTHLQQMQDGLDRTIAERDELRAKVDSYETWAKIDTKGFDEETLKEFASRSVPQEGQPASNKEGTEMLRLKKLAIHRNEPTRIVIAEFPETTVARTECGMFSDADNEGHAEQIVKAINDFATLTQERDALRLHVERLDAALDECWFNDDTTLSLPEWKVELLTQADFKIFSARAALASPEEKP